MIAGAECRETSASISADGRRFLGSLEMDSGFISSLAIHRRVYTRTGSILSPSCAHGGEQNAERALNVQDQV